MNWNRLQPRRPLLAAGYAAIAGFVALVLLATPGAAQPPSPTAPGTPPKKLSVEEYRKLYPFQSIADRLDYESARTNDTAPPQLTSEASKRLDDVEKSLEHGTKWNMRAKSLALLHSEEAEKFVQRDGFGVSRLPTPSVMLLELPPAPTVPFAALKEALDPVNEKKATLPKTAKDSSGALQMPSLDLLEILHRCGEMDFLNLRGFGFVQDREHVSGFQAHQFRTMPQWGNGPSKPKEEEREKERWLVVRLELVSLLKQTGPAVYVATELPRMEELKKARTRSLSEFEGQALKALREGEEVVTTATTNHIGMMGALRASKQCLECHQVRRGDLLGAFSYDLVRDPQQKSQ